MEQLNVMQVFLAQAAPEVAKQAAAPVAPPPPDLSFWGSMLNAGRIGVAKAACKAILKTLSYVDYVGIVLFSSASKVYKSKMVPATEVPNVFPHPFSLTQVSSHALYGLSQAPQPSLSLCELPQRFSFAQPQLSLARL